MNPENHRKVIPIAALFDEGVGPNRANDLRPALAAADVIVGVDVMSEREFLVFGRKTLQDSLASGSPIAVPAMYISLDQDTDELEQLIAAVRAIKGYDDYQAGADTPQQSTPSQQQHVRVYDFQTKALTSIPASELASGMVRATVEGIEGEVWVDASQVHASQGETSQFRHPPFSEPVRERLEIIRRTLADVSPQSLEEWENGFRSDANPVQEIGLWLNMVEVFRQLTMQRSLSLEQKRDIFKVILLTINNGYEFLTRATNPLTLSRNRMLEIGITVVKDYSRAKDLGQEIGQLEPSLLGPEKTRTI